MSDFDFDSDDSDRPSLRTRPVCRTLVLADREDLEAGKKTLPEWEDTPDVGGMDRELGRLHGMNFACHPSPETQARVAEWIHSGGTTELTVDAAKVLRRMYAHLHKKKPDIHPPDSVVRALQGASFERTTKEYYSVFHLGTQVREQDFLVSWKKLWPDFDIDTLQHMMQITNQHAFWADTAPNALTLAHEKSAHKLYDHMEENAGASMIGVPATNFKSNDDDDDDNKDQQPKTSATPPTHHDEDSKPESKPSATPPTRGHSMTTRSHHGPKSATDDDEDPHSKPSATPPTRRHSMTTRSRHIRRGTARAPTAAKVASRRLGQRQSTVTPPVRQPWPPAPFRGSVDESAPHPNSPMAAIQRYVAAAPPEAATAGSTTTAPDPTATADGGTGTGVQQGASDSQTAAPQRPSLRKRAWAWVAGMGAKRARS